MPMIIVYSAVYAFLLFWIVDVDKDFIAFLQNGFLWNILLLFFMIAINTFHYRRCAND